MKQNAFVHLHCHSHFSLLDGNCKLDELIAKTVASGQDAIALTDHGNLFAAISFYKQARAAGIKPILGCEAYMARGSRFTKKPSTHKTQGKKRAHVTLLAENDRGFSNLIHLASTAYVDGFYYKPRIDREILRERSEGLICLSGCLAGEVNQAVLLGDLEQAERSAREYQEIFGTDRFYLEVMDHGMPEQARCRAALEAIGRAIKAPLVATNDIHYINPEDWQAQDVSLCIGTGKLVSDPDRWRMSTHELYFKTADQMAAIFNDCPQAIASTREIADRCNVTIDFNNRFLPSFKTPNGQDSETFFRQLCHEGIHQRYSQVTESILDRLEYELGIIISMGFVDYFLITWDFIRFAREQDIPVGPGRGSAAGSVVAYSLGITDVDPLRYDLLFERFLNSARISMPDIDIDFCKDRRGEVIEYVAQKYGRDHVAQIITFGTLKSRGVIRDVGRVLDVPLSLVDKTAKKVPNGPKDTLRATVLKDQEIKKLYQENDQLKELFDIALKLEGNARHVSIHAAGVVITDQPLVERVPLYRSGDDITTQWPCEQLEELGLLKMDFLGLRNLTIIKEALDNVEAKTGSRPDLGSIPFDDQKTYEMLCRGEGQGVFQLDSEGMRSLLSRFKPDRFEDIVALLALYRPGPLGSGMVESYVRRKHGQEAISYPHPLLEPILKETLGVILYQEQVMRIASTLSGFSLNEADNLRKAMGKKKPDILARFKEQFVQGAIQRQVRKQTAEEVFDLIEYFAGYGFNKSHSVAYAMITYQTAWLKANHPREYMAALLSCEMSSIDKLVEYREACRGMGIPILPPDVNHSMARFAVHDQGIRYALAALRGVGEGALQPLIEAREQDGPFHGLFDLCERVDVQKLNRTAMEALIHAGAMDGLEGNRAQKLAILDDALAVGSAAARDRLAGQGSLFAQDESGQESDTARATALPSLPELPEQERLQQEKAVLGIYLTGHPLEALRATLLRFSTGRTDQLKSMRAGAKVILGGIITKLRITSIRRGPRAGQKMAILSFEDLFGTAEAVVFSDLYQELADVLKEDLICFLEGILDLKRDEPSLKVSALIKPEHALAKLTRRLTLDLEGGEELDLVIPALRRLIKEHSGRAPVFFRLRSRVFGSVILQAGAAYQIDPSGPILDELGKVLGPAKVHCN